MNDTKRAKIGRFLDDVIMSEAIYSVLLDSFLKERPQADVHVLAASRLAVDYLKQGWRDLEKHRNEQASEKKPLDQVGL